MPAGQTSETTRLVLRRGQATALYAHVGSLLICAEGRVQLTDHTLQLDDHPGFRVEMSLCAGETYVPAGSGRVTVHAAREAHVLYVQPVGAWGGTALAALQKFSKSVMMLFIRRGVEQSGSSSGS